MKGRDHSEDLYVAERLILQRILEKYGGELYRRMNSSGSGQRPAAGSCEHRNESSGSIKSG